MDDLSLTWNKATSRNEGVVSREGGLAPLFQWAQHTLSMNKTEVLKRIRDTGLIPVVRAESSDQALREGNGALITERARQFLEIVQTTRASFV